MIDEAMTYDEFMALPEKERWEAWAEQQEARTQMLEAIEARQDSIEKLKQDWERIMKIAEGFQREIREKNDTLAKLATRMVDLNMHKAMSAKLGGGDAD